MSTVSLGNSGSWGYSNEHNKCSLPFWKETGKKGKPFWEVPVKK